MAHPNELLDFLNSLPGTVRQKTRSDRIAQFLWLANEGEETVLKWVKRVEKEGVTPALVIEINRALEKINFIACPALLPGMEKLGFRYANPAGVDGWDDETTMTYWVANLIADGTLNRLKRCEFKECRKYFLGNAKAKYCSDRCGSNVRVRKLRSKSK